MVASDLVSSQHVVSSRAWIQSGIFGSHWWNARVQIDGNYIRATVK